jgi:hypothetical protein
MGKPAQIDIVRRAYELWQQAGEPQAGTKNSIIKRRKSCSKLSTKAPPRPMDKNCPICFGIGWVCDKHPDRA